MERRLTSVRDDDNVDTLVQLLSVDTVHESFHEVLYLGQCPIHLANIRQSKHHYWVNSCCFLIHQTGTQTIG